MKRRKLPYVHILPRILIGVLLFGVLLALLYVPMISRNILSVSSLADAASPVPTDTAIPSASSFSPTPTATALPTETPSEVSATPASDVVTLSAYTTLRLGDDNASVITLQQRLTDLGYLDSDMPGSQYNESIESAVVLFQRACNMAQTGIAGCPDLPDQAAGYRCRRAEIAAAAVGARVLFRPDQRLFWPKYGTGGHALPGYQRVGRSWRA